MRLPDKIKAYYSGSRLTLLSIWLVAILMALFTFSIKYVFEYVSSIDDSTNRIMAWEYQYLDSADDTISEDELRNSSYIEPISTENRKNYCYLRHTFDKVSSDMLVLLKTDYSAVKIIVNGVETYNNHYGQSLYTGNCYNSFVLSPTSRPQTVEVYMTVPFTMQFDVSTQEYEEIGVYNLITAGTVFSAAVVLISFVFLLVSLFVSLKNHIFSSLISIGFIGIFCGVVLGLRYISLASYLFNDPLILNVFLALNMILVSFINFILLGCVGKIKPLSIGFSCAALICAALCIFALDILLIKLAMLCSLVFNSLAIIFNESSFDSCLGRRVKFTRAVWLIDIYILFMFALGFALWAFGISGFLEISLIASFLTFTPVALIAMFHRSAWHKARHKEIQEQFANDVAWIDGIAKMIGKIISQKSDEQMLITAARQMIQLISETKNNADGEELICGVAAVYENDSFREIYKERLEEKCRYDMIISRYLNDGEDNRVYFCETSFDMIFTKKNKLYAVLHFENIKNGLSSEFENIVTILSANIEIVLSHSIDENDNAKRQKKVFIRLAETVEEKCGCSEDHLKTVSQISAYICEELGMSEKETADIRDAAVIHDIGKIPIPDRIINQTGYLSAEEKEIVEKHTDFGYELLSQIPGEFMQTAATIAKYHHECYDGTGYHRIKGDDIPLCARIVAAADVFDALTSKRTYKDAWSAEKAYAYMNERAGSQFDPQVIEAFDRAFERIKNLKKLK